MKIRNLNRKVDCDICKQVISRTLTYRKLYRELGYDYHQRIKSVQDNLLIACEICRVFWCEEEFIQDG